MKSVKKGLGVVMLVGMGSMFVLHTMNPEDRPKDLLDQADDLLYPATGEKADYQRGRELLERVAAQQDDPFSSAYAKQDLADIYKDGLGVEKDEQKGRAYFDEALSAYEQLAANAERNPKAAASANYELGDIYYEGDDYDSDDDKSDASDWVERDADKSRAYFQQASVLFEQVIEQYADLESIGEASLMLGDIYGAGDLGNPDYEKARMFYENVAYNKQMPIKLSMDACSALASLYQYGRGENAVGKDTAKAIKVYNHMATLAERAGKKEYIYQARMRLGDAYAYAAPIDFVKARQEYEKIAEWPDAQLAIAYLYRNGQGDTFPRDIKRAEKYYKSAIANHNASEEQKKLAWENLAIMFSTLAMEYYSGSEEINMDYALARQYFNKVLAIEDALLWNKKMAHYTLGQMSYEGQGGAKNYVEARDHFNQVIVYWIDIVGGEWLKASAELYIGKIYYYGQEGIIEPDYKKAFDHFTHVIENKAAAAYDKAAAYAYAGRMYYNGQGVTRNYIQAGMYSQNALAKAHLREKGMANYTLGMMYYHGHGVHVDRVIARDYLNDVVQNANADPVEIASAQEMIEQMNNAQLQPDLNIEEPLPRG